MPSLLLSQLSRAIGRESASSELRWMKQTLNSPPPGIPPTAPTLEDMVARRVAGEPLQYILGSQPFGPLNLAVRPPVLIPRPETEDWTIRLAELLTPTPERPFNVLDLCTGSGCIPLLLLHLWPVGSAHATGIDVSARAVRLAMDNAALCGIARRPDEDRHVYPQNSPSIWRTTLSSSSTRDPAGTKERTNLVSNPSPCPIAKGKKNTFTAVLADVLRPNFVREARLSPPYDLITSNPPYIPQAEYDVLPESVRGFEDVRALLGDHPSVSDTDVPAVDRAKGLSFYYRIAVLVRDHALLRSRGAGVLALEVGDGQAAAVAAIVEGIAGLGNIDLWQDPWGKHRVVLARSE